MIKCDLFVAHANYNQIDVVLFLAFLPLVQQEELMERHLNGATRTIIRVIGVHFSEILIKGKKI